MFKVKYVDSIMMLVRLDLNLIVSLFLGNGLDYNTDCYFHVNKNQITNSSNKILCFVHVARLGNMKLLLKMSTIFLPS